MADLTASVKVPTLAGQNLAFDPVSADDFFVAAPNASYILIYFNNTTPSDGALTIVDPTTPIPQGSAVAAGFANAVIDPNGLGATVTQVSVIPNSNRFRNADGEIHLLHAGTITDLSVAIFGPFPPMVG